MWTLLGQGIPIEPPTLPPLPSPPATPDVSGAASPVSNLQIEKHFWDLVNSLNYVQAGVLIGIGLVYLLYGWKIYKVLVMVAAGSGGAGLGYWLSQRFDVGWWLAPAIGLVLAVLAWPLMRYAVSVLGGLAGAVLGAFIARTLQLSPQFVAAGAAIGLVTLGLLAFIIFRIVVMGCTSTLGSLVTVAGIVGLAVRIQNVQPALERGLATRGYLLPVMVFVPALIGFVYQIRYGEGQRAAATG